MIIPFSPSLRDFCCWIGLASKAYLLQLLWRILFFWSIYGWVIAFYCVIKMAVTIMFFSRFFRFWGTVFRQGMLFCSCISNYVDIGQYRYFKNLGPLYDFWCLNNGKFLSDYTGVFTGPNHACRLHYVFVAWLVVVVWVPASSVETIRSEVLSSLQSRNTMVVRMLPNC